MAPIKAALKNKLVMRTILFMRVLLEAMRPTPTRGFLANTAAFVSLSPIVAIVAVVLTVIIVVLVLAALAPEFFQAAADITGVLLNADLNSSLANTVAGIVAVLVPLVLLFGFIALIFRAAKGMK